MTICVFLSSFIEIPFELQFNGFKYVHGHVQPLPQEILEHVHHLRKKLYDL